MRNKLINLRNRNNKTIKTRQTTNNTWEWLPGDCKTLEVCTDITTSQFKQSKQCEQSKQAQLSEISTATQAIREKAEIRVRRHCAPTPLPSLLTPLLCEMGAFSCLTPHSSLSFLRCLSQSGGISFLIPHASCAVVPFLPLCVMCLRCLSPSRSSLSISIRWRRTCRRSACGAGPSVTPTTSAPRAGAGPTRTFHTMSLMNPITHV
jgi:hypothetical protein